MVFYFEIKQKTKHRSIYEECEWIGKYASIHNHIKGECKYLFICDCNRIMTIGEKINHLTLCPHTKLSCICLMMIERCKMDSHISSRYKSNYYFNF